MGCLGGKVLENLKRDRNKAIGAVLLLLLLSGWFDAEQQRALL